MKKESLLLLALASLVGVSVAGYGCAQARAQTPAAKAAADPDRGPIELVVYAGDFAMVRETRKVELTAGTARIGLQGVSKSLDQNSVLFGWPNTKDAHVVSSTYDLGMDTSGHLLERFRGKEIELVYRGMDGKSGDRVKGTLEVAEPGNIVVKADGKYLVNPDGIIEAPADTGIVTIPQLSAEVESKAGGPTDLAVTYMTGGLSWGADYTATLQPDSDKLGLECWATVTNKTGTDFPDAKISFVAGSPNRYRDTTTGFGDSDVMITGAVAAEPQVRHPSTLNAAFESPQAMGELYAYPYKSTATIRQDQMNRVRMMGSDSVTVKKVYSIALPTLGRDYSSFSGNPNERMTATMGINFTNAKGSGLGLPMPAGAVRVYEPDSTGAVRYVGAAAIGDTPKDARVNLTLTNVFDVYARGRQVSAQRIDKRHTCRTVEIKVSNEKTKPVEVNLAQSFDGGWRVITESIKGQKLNANMNQWKVKIPAGGEAKLSYVVISGP